MLRCLRSKYKNINWKRQDKERKKWTKKEKDKTFIQFSWARSRAAPLQPHGPEEGPETLERSLKIFCLHWILQEQVITSLTKHASESCQLPRKTGGNGKNMFEKHQIWPEMDISSNTTRTTLWMPLKVNTRQLPIKLQNIVFYCQNLSSSPTGHALPACLASKTFQASKLLHPQMTFT